LSVEAVQLRLIWELEATEALKLAGALGEVASASVWISAELSTRL
jgi:hypothetical protein